MAKLYVLSLGGSLIAPDEIDHRFLAGFRKLIMKQAKQGNRFIIITGGGQVCRDYQQALRKSAKPSADDLDWLGIAATRLNAKLIQMLFGKLANQSVVEDPNKKIAFKEKILVAGGWKPGRSSDDDAVRLAKIYGSKTVINLSNIVYVYDKDPRKFKSARKIEQMSWSEYNRMFSPRWNPGAHVPFDPIAARFAQANKQHVIIANGKDLKNVAKILQGQKFKGTTIK